MSQKPPPPLQPVDASRFGPPPSTIPPTKQFRWDLFATAALLHSIPMKFGCVESFVLVVVFFDHFLYKKSPVHDLNLHQNIFSRK